LTALEVTQKICDYIDNIKMLIKRYRESYEDLYIIDLWSMHLLIYSDSMVAQVQFSEYGESKVHPSSKLATEKNKC